MSNKKIVIINSVYGIGSTGKICSDMAGFFSRKGYSIFVAFGRGEPYGNIDGITPIKIGGKIDVIFHGILTRMFDIHGFGSYFSTKVFLKKLDAIKPDLIFLHNIHGYYINVKLLFNWLKKNSDIPVIWTLHDCWSFTGHCSHFDYIGCEKWQKCCLHCPQKNMYPKTLLFDNCKKNFLAKKQLFVGLKKLTIVSPSLWLNNLVKQSFLGQYDSLVIHNGIDLTIFKKYSSVSDAIYKVKNKKIVLCVSNIWNARKGFNDVLKISKLFDEKVAIFLVGKVRKSDEKYLPLNIIHLKNINSKQEMAQLYSSADAFFNPTLEDNYPTVNLEALACKCPVVSYDTGGCKEALDYNFIVKKGDVYGAYSKILDIFDKRLKLPPLNEKVLSKEIMNESYLEILNNLLG